MPHTQVSLFQELLVVFVLRPDRLKSAMAMFVCKALGVSSPDPPPATFKQLADEANPKTPVLMITTTGADPSRDLSEFAAKEVGTAHYAELAMGGGQQENAMRILTQAAVKGDWVCLKNLHLVTAWLPKLEKVSIRRVGVLSV